MADTAYERVICVKNEVLVYRIPPRPSNRGYRADDWKLDSPDWTGRLRVVSKGTELFIKLEDKNTGELFAQCPVEAHPGIAVEPVMDSSRYFVLRIKDETGRSAFIGIGFHDRSDSFDLNVSLQDHFKWLRQEAEEAKSQKTVDQTPKLDLGFKEGQTITLNLGSLREGKPRAKPVVKAGGIGLLPPPPGGIKAPPPAAAPSQPLTAPSQSTLPQDDSAAEPEPPLQPEPQSTPNVQSVDLLFNLGVSAPSTNNNTASSTSQNPPDLWGDFTGAGASQPTSTESSDVSSNNWIQF